MASSKPHVVVFYGGTAGNHDLSRESGTWFCEYVPRSKYQITPVEVTPEGLWKVPLGSLPAAGSVKKMMAALSDAVRPQQPTQALQRLISRPINAFMTLLRGQGGDDGATHSLGQILATPVVGSPLSTSQHTSNKYVFHNLISHVAATPQTRSIQADVAEADALQEITDEFTFPLFLKPLKQEGSLGIEHVGSMDDLLAAFRRARLGGDMLVQERRPGQEISITLVEGRDGRPYALPTTLIVPRQGAFYDQMAKRRAGRAKLHTPNVPDNKVIAEAETIAQDIWQELGCKGIATVDMIAGDDGIDVLEVNTVPTFTQFTPLPYQLKAAGIHPTALFDALLLQTLNQNR